jgi:hypothetical protein
VFNWPFWRGIVASGSWRIFRPDAPLVYWIAAESASLRGCFVALGIERDYLMAKAGKNGKAPDTLTARLLERKKSTEGASVAGFDAELLDKSPLCHELMVTVIKDEKKMIDPASMLVFCRLGSWHACLTHKGLGLKWWGEGGTFAAALDALERAVGKEEGQGPASSPHKADEA